jgi:hypothetical protein
LFKFIYLFLIKKTDLSKKTEIHGKKLIEVVFENKKGLGKGKKQHFKNDLNSTGKEVNNNGTEISKSKNFLLLEYCIFYPEDDFSPFIRSSLD